MVIPDHILFLPWIVLFSPFIAAVWICFFGLKSPKLSGTLALAGILISLVGSIVLFMFYRAGTWLPAESSWSWIKIVGLHVEFGFLVDRLSILMLLIVTGVSSCIFFYSLGYMKGDTSFPRYFASLSLFAFSMIGIVLANNFLMLFVFWELVAVSSYLLIGFWFEKPSAADAGNKAFIVNRLADFGFVLGIFYVWMLSGIDGGERTFNFTALSSLIPQAAENGLLTPAMLLTASILIFCGAVGKSAQFPLYIWLPDAMEGPTPVSALIHAATMVAAGVYLMSRAFFLVSTSADALNVMANIGAITALLAAILAVVQNDIKKILAYSTISQLGYMVMALGLGSSTVAMYHLSTHAFFKALLFLGAGAMIHGLHTQNIWEMGSLLRKMPVTAYTFLIGTLALCGVPPFSGFFSKDEILLLAFEHNRLIYVVALFTAMLTAFYMTRVIWIAILRPGHDSSHSHETTHDAPWIMKAPLLVLALLSAVGGFIGIPEFILGEHIHETQLNLSVAATSVVAAFLGISIGTFIYSKKKLPKDPLIEVFGETYQFVVKKYYLDEFFSALAGMFQNTLARMLFWFDSNVVMQKGVDGVAGLTRGLGSFLRRAQTGFVQTYALVFGFGIAALIYFMLMRG